MAETAQYFDFVVGELPGMQARWEEYKARQPNGVTTGRATRFTLPGL